MNTKTNEFYLSILSNDYDLIFLTETWLSESVKSSEYFGDMYQVFRSLNGRKGRGILTAVSHKYSAKLIQSDLPYPEIDLLIVKVSIGNVSLIVINLYFPPSTDTLIYESVFDYLEHSYELSNNCIIVGDFNVPELVNRLHNNQNPTNSAFSDIKFKWYL